MPSAEEILNARDSGAVPVAEETEDQPRVQTDEHEEILTDGPPMGGDREDPDSGSDEDGKRVPLKALHAEREKSKRYTEEVVDLRRQIAELTQAVLQPKPPPPPPAEPPKPPDFDWDNPIGTVDQRVQAAVEQRIAQERGAIAAEFQRQREAVQSQFAITRHGKETVEEAYAALASARGTDPQWASDYRRIMQSPDQYEAMVAWHKQRKALNEVGSDLEGYKNKIRAEYLEELRNGRTVVDERETPPRRASVMPSSLSGARSVGSRTGPAWEGPPSIQDILSNR
jgi:hypothetical protein